jgi:hypothetical protein
MAEGTAFAMVGGGRLECVASDKGTVVFLDGQQISRPIGEQYLRIKVTIELPQGRGKLQLKRQPNGALSAAHNGRELRPALGKPKAPKRRKGALVSPTEPARPDPGPAPAPVVAPTTGPAATVSGLHPVVASPLPRPAPTAAVAPPSAVPTPVGPLDKDEGVRHGAYGLFWCVAANAVAVLLYDRLLIDAALPPEAKRFLFTVMVVVGVFVGVLGLWALVWQTTAWVPLALGVVVLVTDTLLLFAISDTVGVRLSIVRAAAFYFMVRGASRSFALTAPLVPRVGQPV